MHEGNHSTTRFCGRASGTALADGRRGFRFRSGFGLSSRTSPDPTPVSRDDFVIGETDVLPVTLWKLSDLKNPLRMTMLVACSSFGGHRGHVDFG